MGRYNFSEEGAEDHGDVDLNVEDKGSATNRFKYTVLICESISPMLPAEMYQLHLCDLSNFMTMQL